MTASKEAAAGFRELTGTNPDDAAGLIQVRVARQTGTIVAVYDAVVAGIEDDPTIPWATICETHNAVICHRTRRLAVAHAADPAGWCEPCMSAVHAT